MRNEVTKWSNRQQFQKKIEMDTEKEVHKVHQGIIEDCNRRCLHHKAFSVRSLLLVRRLLAALFAVILLGGRIPASLLFLDLDLIVRNGWHSTVFGIRLTVVFIGIRGRIFYALLLAHS